MPGFLWDGGLWQPGNHPPGPPLNAVDIDLRVDLVEIIEAGRTAGTPLTFRATIKNYGTSPAPAGRLLEVFFRIDGVLQTWSNTHTLGLAASASVTLTANAGTVGSRWTSIVGNHTLQAVVDPANLYAETTETNNTLSLNFTITSVSAVTFKHGAFVSGQASEMAGFASATATTPLVGLIFSFNPSAGFFVSGDLDAWTTWLLADSRRRLEMSIRLLGSDQVRQWDSNTYDAAHTTLVNNLVSRGIAGRLFIRPGWEMNASFGFPWQPAGAGDVVASAAGYVRCWNRILPRYDTLRAAGALVTWCPIWFPTDVGQWYPDAEPPDVIGMDKYNDGYESGGTLDPAAHWAPINVHFQRQIAWAASHGNLYLSLDEYAVGAPSALGGSLGDDPYYIHRVADLVQANRYLYTTYFDNPDGGNVGTTLEANPSAKAAYTQRFAGYTS